MPDDLLQGSSVCSLPTYKLCFEDAKIQETFKKPLSVETFGTEIVYISFEELVCLLFSKEKLFSPQVVMSCHETCALLSNPSNCSIANCMH